MDWNVEWIGIIAGLLTTCAFFPQVVKTLRSRSTGDLSWAWLVMMTTGVFMWLIYGYFAGSPSVFTANVITFFSLLALLWVKVSGGRAPWPKLRNMSSKNEKSGNALAADNAEKRVR